MLRRLAGTTAPDIMIVQFRNEKVSNRLIPITIDCNVVAFIVFEEQFVCWTQPFNQEACAFIAKQNSLMKIGNNGNLVLGPFNESTRLLDDRFDELPNSN
ncbi:hypothetical protein TNCV_4716211 [Trichonephila clavipes]|nr:hypothetical protein TNCV_4716211 [Trichonephila clavipes]